MAVTITHSKVSAIADDADTSLVRPSDWNDDHVIDGPLGGFAVAKLGTTTIGASFDTTSKTVLKKVSFPGPGLVTGINVAIKGASSAGARIAPMIFSDNAGTPNLVVATQTPTLTGGSSGIHSQLVANATARFVSIPMTYYVAAAGDYWIAVNTVGFGGGTDCQVAYSSGTGSDRTIAATTSIGDHSVTPSSTGTNDYSINCDFAASGIGVIHGGLVGRKSYRPGSNGSTFGAITSTSIINLDPTNLVVSFVAPTGGVVDVRLTGAALMSDASQFIYWGLRDGSGQVSGTGMQGINDPQSGSVILTSSAVIRVTGLTPGASYTYYWAVKVSGGSANMYGGPDFGSFEMEVRDGTAGSPATFAPATAIRGRINADGTTASGSGFTSAKTATGRYTITFTTAFAAAPVVVLTPHSTGGVSSLTALLDAGNPPTTTVVKVQTFSGGGAAFADSVFEFIAMAV